MTWSLQKDQDASLKKGGYNSGCHHSTNTNKEEKDISLLMLCTSLAGFTLSCSSISEYLGAGPDPAAPSSSCPSMPCWLRGHSRVTEPCTAPSAGGHSGFSNKESLKPLKKQQNDPSCGAPAIRKATPAANKQEKALEFLPRQP